MTSKKILLMLGVMILLVIGMAGAVEGAKFGLMNIVDNKLVTGAVNSLIIFLVLLGLVAILNPEKDTKLNIPYVIFSLVIAVAIGFNIGSLLWKAPTIKDFMHMKVFVNLGVVTALLLFLQGLILKDKLNIPQAKVAFGILILVLAVAIVKPDTPYSDKTYRYVWERPLGTQMKFYLVGLHPQTEPAPGVPKPTARWYTDQELDEALGLKEPEETQQKPKVLGEPDTQSTQRGNVMYGVITGTALWVLILGTIVYTAIFTLVFKPEGPKWVYFGISLLLASTTANTGGGDVKGTLVVLGEFVVFILFYRSFGGGFEITKVGFIKMISVAVPAYLLTIYIFGLTFPCDAIGMPHFIKEKLGIRCPEQIGLSIGTKAAEPSVGPATDENLRQQLEPLSTDDLIRRGLGK